ncbi:sugar-transfer associated ATP-grasp domain-containing protein [Marivita hallyeonensis]|uniref:Sugar-transfer associated ATP-grasp n=1 Tax=Marivita hallyeonensis TaxID=996342 RepID=A0A1M5QIZ2_9RHOB|nr:sugar-transfer associated ATP-grasp domain-containing protein [Marivita hallyeonensis]SHH13779.1 Sugar-transfer associated ATP-grasp [Marivita hallyeonensis]
MSVYVEDLALIEGKTKVNAAEQLAAAAKASGLSPITIALDFFKLRKQRGKLKLYEYLMYKLYDRSKYTDDQRSRFISAHIHWPTIKPCNDPQWWSVTEDKWLSFSILAAHGVPQPRNAAVYDASPRYYPDVPKVHGADALKDFLTTCKEFPLFAKNLNGMWSAGAVRLSGCTDTHVMVDGRDPVTYEELANDVFGDRSYLIQHCVVPHSFFDGVTDAVATVRCLNLITDDGFRVPFTLLKLPMGANIADNFWRKGNLVCLLEPETGEIKRIVANRNGELTELDGLPGSDRKFLGETLPYWKEVLDVNEKVALMHGANRFGSTDIAITEDGPVVIEVNNGCAFELIQIATGEGFLTDEILAFFESCGVTLK